MKADGLIMVGPFPPPLHGMSAINAAVRAEVRRENENPLVIDLSAPTLERSFIRRLDRLPRVVSGLARMVLARPCIGRPMYMSVSGGGGQAYEVLFALVARLRGFRLFLHHHSFAYVDRPAYLMRLLARAAGKNAEHIALSADMARKLRNLYSIENVLSISNAAFLDSLTEKPMPTRLQTIGFIGNLSDEKGVFHFLDLCALASAKGLSISGALAGPFQDAETEARVRARLNELHNVEYLGPRYGEEKQAFYRSIDVLVFPSQYVNEAEPVTIHEAMRDGIPVIAYARGAISEIVDESCGLVIDGATSFPAAALCQIEKWVGAAAEFGAAASGARRRFLNLRKESHERWSLVLQSLVNPLTEVTA